MRFSIRTPLHSEPQVITWPHPRSNGACTVRQMLTKEAALEPKTRRRRRSDARSVGVIICRNAALGVAILCAAACAPAREDAKSASVGNQCGPSDARSAQLPFVRVSLGPDVHDGVGYVRGPRARVLVNNPAEWAALWKTIGDTLPLPEVSFGDSALIVVASEEFPTGPNRVEIEDVRRCRDTGQIVVYLRLHTRQGGYDYSDRSIRAALLGKSRIGGRPLAFVDLPADVTP